LIIEDGIFRGVRAKELSLRQWTLQAEFKIPYVYDYITKLCRRQAEVILNHKNSNVRAIGQGEARHRKHKRLKLGGGQVYDRSSV
jgi:hypothetical protein